MNISIVSWLAALGLFVLYVVVWTICLLGWRTARIRYCGKAIPSRLKNLPAESVPGVTIIRPLCGLDSNMYNTLESVMRLDYPKYEVIFAVQDPEDEGLPVVRMIMSKYPNISSRIIINPEIVGVNPKVNNLIKPFAEAKYDLLWVIDVTISVTPDTLGRMVDAFLSPSSELDVESAPLISDSNRSPPTRGNVGLVHQVPYAVVYQKTWGSLIEQAYLNTTHAKMYLSIVNIVNTVAVESCVVGKSNLYSKANIASLTTPSPTLRLTPNPPSGLAGFGPFLAEDNMIALSIWHELGLRHAMTSDVALDFLGALSVKQYIDRRVRWIRVRKHMTFTATLLEPLTESLLSGIYGSWAISRLFGGNKMALFLVHMGVWLTIDLGVRSALATRVSGIGPRSDNLVFVIAWFARECLALPVWIYGMSGSKVVWRGRRFNIVGSGEAVPLEGSM